MHYMNNLYVYPLSLTMSKPDNYMIRVYFLENDRNGVLDPKNVDAICSTVFFDPLYTQLRRCSTSAVVYKSKTPIFSDEIKIRMPDQLAAGHHLLFVVCRVRVKAPKKTDPSTPETPCGFGFLPILKDDVFVGHDHDLMLFSELPPNYLSLPIGAVGGLRPIEGSKPIFKLRLSLASSIYPHEKSIFGALNLLTTDFSTPDVLKNTQFLSELRDIPPLMLISHLPLLLQHLLHMIGSETKLEGRHHQGLDDLTVEALVALCRLNQSLLDTHVNILQLLQSFVYHIFNPELYHPQFFLRLMSRWLAALSAGNGQDDTLIHFAFFLFGIIFKSMVHYSQRQAEPFRRSLEQFPPETYTLIYQIVVQLIWEAQERVTTALVIGKDLMFSLVFFFQDLFLLLDRGFVLQLVSLVISRLCPNEQELTLIDFKFAFLKTMSNFQYWVHLNLPCSPTPFTQDDISNNFLQRHYLVSLLLTQLSQYASHKEHSVRLLVYSHLRAHLYDLFYDPRFQKAVHRNRVAELYFPYIIFVVDRISIDQSASHAEKRTLFICFLYLLQATPVSFFLQWWKIESVPRLCRFFETLRTCLSVFEFVGAEKLTELMGVDQGAQISDSTKAMLEGFYTNTSSPSANRKGVRNFRSLRSEQQSSIKAGKAARTGGFTYDELREVNLSTESSFIILDIVSALLQHLEDKYGVESLPQELVAKIFQIFSQFLRLNQSSEFLEHFYPSLRFLIRRLAVILFKNGPSTFVADLMGALFSHLNCSVDKIRSQAMATVYLMALINFEVCGEQKLTRTRVQMAHTAVRMEGQDTRFLQQNIAGVVHHMQENGSSLDSSFASQFLAIMNHMNSVLKDMDLIDRHKNNLEKKQELLVQVAASFRAIPDLRTTWLEKLAQDHITHQQWAEAASVYMHLASLSAEYLCVRYGTATTPPVGGTLLASSSPLISHSPHPEGPSITSSSPASIASSATFSASSSSSSSTFSSSSPTFGATFSVSSSSSTTTSLTSSSTSAANRERVRFQGWPSGIRAVAKALSTNIFEEQLPAEYVLCEKDSVCRSPIFDGVEGFLACCDQAVSLLHKATLWESVYKIDKLLIPIFEHRRAFSRLNAVFDDLQSSYQKVRADHEARTRTLGHFYRVAFWGAIFGEEAGREYIYKTPLLTRLGEIKDRLEGLYRAEYGEEAISVWPRNEPPETVPSGQGYVQITAVDPYFDSSELASNRVTYYEQNCNINRFCYAIAFTQSGGGQHADSLADQWKRLIILTTEKKFPTLKTRLRIVSTSSIEISPIEASIDNIQGQVRKLASEIQNPNAKSLQMVLQGSLLVQVQAGPKAIATTFFDPKAAGTYDPKALERLRLALQSFLKVCREAISFNRLIAPDQVLLQDELENSYSSFETLLSDLGVIPTIVRRFQAVQVQ